MVVVLMNLPVKGQVLELLVREIMAVLRAQEDGHTPMLAVLAEVAASLR